MFILSMFKIHLQATKLDRWHGAVVIGIDAQGEGASRCKQAVAQGEARGLVAAEQPEHRRGVVQHEMGERAVATDRCQIQGAHRDAPTDEGDTPRLHDAAKLRSSRVSPCPALISYSREGSADIRAPGRGGGSVDEGGESHRGGVRRNPSAGMDYSGAQVGGIAVAAGGSLHKSSNDTDQDCPYPYSRQGSDLSEADTQELDADDSLAHSTGLASKSVHAPFAGPYQGARRASTQSLSPECIRGTCLVMGKCICGRPMCKY
jgi:hypothetical protein